MNQTLDIASRILASLVAARPTGNFVTQAAEALDRTDALLRLADSRGFDISVPPESQPNAPTPVIPSASPYDAGKPLSFGSKRNKS